MTENRRNEPATEPQKDKLRFFGCTWDDGITAGQATDALTECAKLFPDREAAWQVQKPKWSKIPGTFPVETLEKLDAAISEEVTIQKAEAVETQPTTAAAPAFIPPPPRPQNKIETPPHEVPIQAAKSSSAQPSARHEGFFSGTAETRRDVNPSNNQLGNAASGAGDSAAIKAHYSPQTDSYTFVFIYPTSEQLNAIRAYGKQPPKGLTFTEAEKLLEQCKILHLIKLRADILRRATIQKAETAAGQPSVRREGFFSGESQPETRKTEAASCQSTKEWDEWFALLGQIKKWAIPFDDLAAQEVTIHEVETAAAQPGARHEDEETGVYSQKVQDLIAQLKNPDKHTRDRAAIELGQSRNPLAVKPLILSLEDDHWGVRSHAAQALGELGFPDAVQALIETLLRDTEVNTVRATAAEALGKIKDTGAIAALNLTLNKDQSQFVRKAAHEALSKIRGDARIPPPQISAQRPSSYQPAPIPSRQSMDEILKTCPSSDGCYWLPVETAAKLANIVTETKLTNGESRQIATQIEWYGYCFEPDARYGGGTYDIDQTLVVFKPFAGDQVNPSPGYLGAANLLRLCVLIAAADGQIDEVELDVFRQVIETQLDLTPTDHRRLQVLEKLLVLNPSSAEKTLASVAKSIPAHKRLLIGKVLVRVAAADTVFTKDERRALERIFKAFEISQDTLENLMRQACPQSQAARVQETAAASIPVKPETPEDLEAELTRQKEWDEWVALQERLAERQKQSEKAAGVSSLEITETAHQYSAPTSEGVNLTRKKISDLEKQLSDYLLQDGLQYDQATREIISDLEKQLSDCLLQEQLTDRQNKTSPEAAIQKAKDSPGRDYLATPEQLSELRSNGIEAGPGLKFVEANELIESCRAQEKKARAVKIQETEPEPPTYIKYPLEPRRENYSTLLGYNIANTNWIREVTKIETENRRLYDIYFKAFWKTRNSWNTIEEPLPFPKSPLPQGSSPQGAAIQKSSTPKNSGPQGNIPEAPEEPGYYSRVTREQLDELRSHGENPTSELIYYGAAKLWIENCKARYGFRKPQNINPEVAGGRSVSERSSKPVAPPAIRHFALDMIKVDFITNETREVVGILSGLMEDEPEATITQAQRVEVSAPEVPAVPEDGKSAPQPSRFGGLSAAFIPILQRLLTCDSWPQADFHALAREFQFMPLNIRDTLNEWSDEALGDFILDGEDPVFVRRELMTKEKI